MYLKRIEIEGFKSFADRTVIPVERGLTGIVGPNGCGKSNVVDALLWVLGERSAKALRADAMGDVIFKGAEGRPEGPYALVEVILGDPDGRVVEPGGEVAVGRRLFRSGESEFLLHGRKVRRKDVREVLLDTGLGVRGYMVLAQGKIDAVLAANPADRRSVFEEAAGISRYQARKHETMLKLRRVEQDLERVEDVLREVSRAVRSLKLQAGKAKRYLETRDRYRELRVRVALADASAWAEEERTLRAREGELQEEVERVRAARAEAERELSELEREEETLRARHEGLRAEAGEVKERAAGLEERVHGLEARAAESEARIARDGGRLDELGEAQTEEERAAAELAAQEPDLDTGLERARAAREEAEAAFVRARDERRAVRERMETLRSAVLEALAERTQEHNRVAEAARRRSEAEGALAARERRGEELRGEAAQLDAEREEAARAEEARRAEARAADERSAQLQEECGRLRAEHEAYAAAADEASQRAAAARARIEAIQVVEEEMPGAPEHVRALHEDDGSPVAGWLLDGVRIEPPWDRLVENLLGRLQHGLWLTDGDALPADPGGMCDFFFAAGGDGEVPMARDGARPLRSLLDGDEARIASLCARLGPVYCVDEAAEARRLARRHADALFLSRDGELHGHGYARTGILGEEAAGVLARRNVRVEARQRLELAQAEHERSAVHARETGAQWRNAQDELEGAESARRAAHAGVEEATARHAALAKRHAAVDEEVRALDRERREWGAEVEEARAMEEQAGAARDAAEERRERANVELSGLQEIAETHDHDYDAAAARLQDARMACSQAEQERQRWEERVAGLQGGLDKRGRERRALEEEIAELRRAAESLRGEAEEARRERSALLQRRAALDERVAEAGKQLGRAVDALGSARARHGGDSGRVETLLGERQEIALRVQKVQMRQEELVRALHEDFGQSLEDLARALEIDPRAPIPAEEDGEALRAELDELKRRVDAIGAVNLDAVEELEERQEREDFLLRERDDLNAARTKLQQTLEDLDAQCRKRFLETFEKVQGNFEQIFRRLFRGGRAELALEQEADPLEGGIEVIVRPPGKELRSINLLSGGERTLTALALLLAVFQSRPSPFCLLDEVDAALDDANVERFLDVLDDFVGTTQFLVVTHNRITMAHCERLFGVTMRKRGVSLVVSVEMDGLAGQEGEVDLSGAEAVDPARVRQSQRALEAGG